MNWGASDGYELTGGEPERDRFDLDFCTELSPGKRTLGDPGEPR